MPRGIVLIRHEGDWNDVESSLRDMQTQLAFVEETRCIIESWCPCMGSADYAARVFGISLEAIRQASLAIRRRVAAKMVKGSAAVTLTTTIVGSTRLEQQDPFGHADRLFEIHRKFGKGSGKSRGKTDDHVDAAVVVFAYLSETVPGIESIVSAFSQSQPDGILKEKFGPISTRLKELVDELNAISSKDRP